MSTRLLPMISFEDNGLKEFGSEIAGSRRDSQQTQPKTKIPTVRTARPVKSEQPSGSLTLEIDKSVFWLRKHQCKHGETCEQLYASVC